MSLTNRQASALRKWIATDIRKLCDMVFPAVKPYDIGADAVEAAAAVE